MSLQNSLCTTRHLHISRWALCDIILENSCLLADIIIFRDIFRGQFSEQNLQDVLRKDQNFQNPSQKISSEKWSKKYLSEGERIQNYAGILWNNVIKHSEIFWRFWRFTMTSISVTFLCLIFVNFWCVICMISVIF